MPLCGGLITCSLYMHSLYDILHTYSEEYTHTCTYTSEQLRMYVKYELHAGYNKNSFTAHTYTCDTVVHCIVNAFFFWELSKLDYVGLQKVRTEWINTPDTQG
jgi:hypothetical protein